MKKIGLLEHLYKLKERAEANFSHAVQTKRFAFDRSIDRLNSIDQEIDQEVLSEERRRCPHFLRQKNSFWPTVLSLP
jgi:hypothetical protein